MQIALVNLQSRLTQSPPLHEVEANFGEIARDLEKKAVQGELIASNYLSEDPLSSLKVALTHLHSPRAHLLIVGRSELLLGPRVDVAVDKDLEIKD